MVEWEEMEQMLNRNNKRMRIEGKVRKEKNWISVVKVFFLEELEALMFY
jgi:hypothetical protein